MKNKVALIFGASGQDGFYLSALLEQLDVVVIKISRKNSEVTGSVADYNFVAALIKQYQPAFIFHFAANSTTRHDSLFENHETICTGTLNILEGAKLYCPLAKIFLSGSALQFKNNGLPINEDNPFEANSPYAVARIQSVFAARYYRKAFGLQVYVGYFFNHDSPLRTEQHVNQKIVKAAQRIANGSDEKLVLGDIDVKKEFNYAGDIVGAVWKFINQEIIFEMVIGSGIAYSIKDWLSCCFESLGLDWKNYVVLQEGFVPEYAILISSPQLLMGIGWKPHVDFYKLANMMIND